MNDNPDVAIVGAGPVGLAAAVVLSQRGVRVLVLEKRNDLGQASKASTFHPPTLEMLAEFGVIDAMLAAGKIADRIQYRLNSGEVVAEFDHALLRDETPYPFRLHLEQAALTPLLLARLQANGGSIRYGAEVLSVGSDAEHAWVEIQQPGAASERIKASFVLGADGAHSAVRESLGIATRGITYPGRVLRLVTSDRLEEFVPGLGQISYVFAPDGTSISLLQMPGCWRVIIRLPEGFDADEVTRPEWYMPHVHTYLPALPERLNLISQDIYGASKMVADATCRGRVFLIGDATHLTNTRGGMNMNCGIHDAYEVGRALAEAVRTGDPAPAQAAAEARRRAAVDELLPRTDRNVTGGAEWMEHMRAVSRDPEAARAQLHRGAMMDFAPARQGAPKGVVK